MQDLNKQAILNKQRLDKFRIVIALPEILRDINTSDWNTVKQDLINRDSLQFSLTSANIPDVAIPSKELGAMGQRMKVTSQARSAYNPVTCKFAVDNRFRNYWVLWKWLEALNDPKDSAMDDSLALPTSKPFHRGQIPTTPANFWGYQTRISIFPLDEYNKEMCEFIFNNAFITNLVGANFSYQDANQLESEFTFDFGQMEIKLVN